MRALRLRAVVVAVVLALCACAAPPYSEVRTEWPPIPQGSGRLVFLGDNHGWYGLFEGVRWAPVLSIDGHELDVGRGKDVYFAADVPAGSRRIAVDGQDQLRVLVEPDVTKYVEMERYSVETHEFTMRAVEWRMRLVQLSELHAQPKLDRLDFIGFAEL